jgi:galactokinase
MPARFPEPGFWHTWKGTPHLDIQDAVTQACIDQFGLPPAALVRAPGRVNLIGEHTDYNDGFVLPLAINRAIWIALIPRADRQVVAYSLDYDERITLSLQAIEHGGPGWSEYLKGVAWALEEAGYQLTGWQGALAGDVPLGAGLSSSAALELATARAFAAVSHLNWSPPEMARLAQKAENRWVGVNCGIMDQMISAAGVAGHALLIDCRSLQTTPAPFPEGTVVVVMDTNTRRGLVDSAYNERRAQCEEASRFFGVPALRDVDLATFKNRAAEMPPLTRRRARHVITENQRTLQAVEAMQCSDARLLGELMKASHISLRDDFEVSSPELDLMVELATRQPGCFGARMTGGGFGGCAVALVGSAVTQAFVAAVEQEYESKSGIVPQLYVCRATNGAEIIYTPLES